MKIAAVSMVKNECDIIELFIRINARVIDHFFIVDNSSSDSTCQILDKLIAEGFPITLSSDSSVDHPQERVITNLVRDVARRELYDWIIPLDADEFIQAGKSEMVEALSEVPAGEGAMLQWATFVPTSAQYFSCANPLWTHFRQRAKEPRSYRKIIIPNRLARNGTVTSGNHGFRKPDSKKSVRWLSLDVRLAHVPVRSSEQLTSKAIIGSHKLSIKENRRSTEGFHWEVIASQARDNDYALSDAMLKDIALSYGSRAEDPMVEELLPDSRIGSMEDCIQYPELGRSNLLARYDAFMAELCSEIRNLQKAKKKKFGFF